VALIRIVPERLAPERLASEKLAEAKKRPERSRPERSHPDKLAPVVKSVHLRSGSGVGPGPVTMLITSHTMLSPLFAVNVGLGSPPPWPQSIVAVQLSPGNISVNVDIPVGMFNTTVPTSSTISIEAVPTEIGSPSLSWVTTNANSLFWFVAILIVSVTNTGSGDTTHSGSIINPETMSAIAFWLSQDSPTPSAPVSPCGPVAPVAPIAPVSPCGPGINSIASICYCKSQRPCHTLFKLSTDGWAQSSICANATLPVIIEPATNARL